MKKLITLFFALPFLLQPVVVEAQNGELDPNFGNNGFLYTNFEIDIAEYFLDMIVLPNDQFVMVGYINHANSHDLLIARFNSDGTIDGSFGEGGYTTIDIQDDSNDEANGVAALDDGKLLIVGNTFIDGSGQGFILRLNADGSLDTSFGEGGNGYTLLTAGTEFYTGVEDIYVVSNNDILVAGTVSNEDDFDFGVFKLTGGGGINVSFGSNGAALIDINNSDDYLTSMDVTDDGRILLGGFAYTDVNSAAVARLTIYGTPDNTFNGSGTYHFDEGSGQNIVGDVLSAEDGKVVIVGSEGDSPDINGFVFKLNEDGSLDNSFSSGGKLFSDVGATNGVYLYKAHLLPGNRILTTGHLFGNSMQSVYALMLQSNGTPETDFSSGGDIDHPLTQTAAELLSSCSGVQSDGSILIGGTIGNLDMDFYNMYLSRIENSVSTNLHELYITNPTLSVFPNPISQVFSIEWEEAQDLEILELYNLQGRLLQQWTAAQSSYQLDSQLPPGTYLLAARSGSFRSTSTLQVIR